MNKRLLIIGLVIIALFAISAVAYASLNSTTKGNTVPPSSGTNTPTPKDGGQAITVSGVIGCLTPKDTSGPMTASCAVGVKADDGKSYALSADDPTLTGGVPTGSKVLVTGTLSNQSSEYDTVGVIKVTSLERK